MDRRVGPAVLSASLHEGQADGMRQWPRSGLRVHAGVGVSAADCPFALRHGRCVAEMAALAGRTARTAPGSAPASPQLAPEGSAAGTAAPGPLELLIRVRC